MTDMITRFTRSLEIVQASIKVLRSDSRLLVLPLLSGAATAIVAGAFIWGATASGAFAGMESGAGAQALPLWSYAWLFVFYFVHARVWAVPVRDARGQLMLWIGGTSNKNKDVFEQKFRDLTEQITEQLKLSAKTETKTKTGAEAPKDDVIDADFREVDDDKKKSA